MKNSYDQTSIRLLSWNMNHSPKAWEFLFSSVPLPDVALLQEALKPKMLPLWSAPTAEDSWQIQGYKMEFCSAIVGLSDRVKGRPLATCRIGDLGEFGIPVSVPGTIALAEIVLRNGEAITVVSAYSKWEYTYPKKRPNFADASAHRVISDISSLVSSSEDHKIIVAGDWNIFHGYGDDGSDYWKSRYQTVFGRMEALGLKFVGPYCSGGIQVSRNPSYFPSDSKNVPTFRRGGANRPDNARDKFDFVFASSGLQERLHIRALNAPEEWGPSDHCRIAIDLS